MRIYISGPMTGILDCNREAFALVFVAALVLIVGLSWSVGRMPCRPRAK